ncbi:hypothetical protein BHE74_00015204 [Ensete ventricosum]|nr:hypothetical protein BHE74_00015204 [Ensete ventricosum]
MCTPIIGNAGCLPVLLPDQARKLKQLSVLTLAEIEKVLMYYTSSKWDNFVLSYDHLMEELDVSNVRELEDFLINECMYVVSICGIWYCKRKTGSITQVLRGW